MNALSPIVAEAVALRPDAFPSLILPSSAVLAANTRPFSIAVTVLSGTAETFKLLEHADLLRQIGGYLSAKVVGPLAVTMTANLTSNPTIIAGFTVIGLHPGWAPTTAEHVHQIPDRIVLGIGAMATVVQSTLPLPPAYKDNAVIAQVAGLTPSITVFPKLVGASSVTVVFSGLVQLEGMVALKPWA